jgi:hypothetical protein
MRFSKKQAIAELRDYVSWTRKFSPYSPGYCVTNEKLRDIMGILQPGGKKVLTVAGSGDQPLWFAMNGAARTDTFDITFCSKAVMDMKTAAIPRVNHAAYCYFVKTIYNDSRRAAELASYLDMPADSRRFINVVGDNRIVSKGTLFYEGSLPTEKEYEILRRNIDRPFHFIWSDLASLSAHLRPTTKYDIIYLSNIFQYTLGWRNMHRIVKDLIPHLSNSGRIMLYTTWLVRSFELDNFTEVVNRLDEYKMSNLKWQGAQMILLEKGKPI